MFKPAPEIINIEAQKYDKTASTHFVEANI